MDRPRALRIALLLLVIGYGTVLRFDALTLTYGPVSSPGWLRALQESRGAESALRPAGFKWERWQGRYISDPYTYLQFAREMRSFYAAHRREPLFPFATKIALKLLGNQDIAVSFASMFFSVLAIAATFLLGRAAFNGWVGLGAAAAIALEYDAVTWGIGGWRDDAFMCAVVLLAWAMVRVMRVPSLSNGVILGIVAAAAVLTRITSLSFLLPGFAVLLVVTPRPWTGRLRSIGVALAVAALLAGPYIVSCWVTFGDPLYAINVHADIYRAAEGQTVAANRTAGEYIRTALASRPWATFDTALQGMTTYPFTNKWTGFNPWSSALGNALEWLSAAGLLLFLRTREGRLLLIVLAGSLVPYALTWKLIFDWRFTMHAYPFFLIAAFYALHELVSFLRPSRIRELRQLRPRRGPALAWTAAVVLVAAGMSFILLLLPPRVAAETLRAGDPLSFGPSSRDWIYFDGGWSPPAEEGNAVVRISGERVARIRLPLPAGRDYAMTLRMDPVPAPAQDENSGSPFVRVLVNDQLVGVLELQYDPQRIGSYRMTIPAAVLRGGRNRLALIPSDREGRERKIRFWYVRVRAAPTG